MHTTFIPTFTYLTVITLAWIGKLIILPIYRTLERGHEHENPHDLTAAVFAFVTVVFMAIANLIGKIPLEEAAKI